MRWKYSATADCSHWARLIIIVDWRRRNYTALEGRSVLNIRFYYYEERRSGVRTARRGGRLRAITFDIRNYSSADGGAGEAGSADIPSPWGRTKRSRVASAGLAAAAVAQRVVWQSPWTRSAPPPLPSPSRARISHTLPKCTLALAGSCWLLPNTHC